ncbi:type I-E CRISPR-associated endoribonuclease Cas2e [Deinococcus sp. SL84]|uniref:type I-E CRISPR-associated endoribonuclease Cas2e n=1 Tax=Deinococcus sp. SL84 TaxID=2994663 RepID=UPI00227600A9|nr:type I-E CRISPR-associated endoribonuclease Cas2e [Deinococcus sp. SL84]MCY1703448.1 type I-E CRISPR-associated endoribonuclease Cas2e [Deinococcus sp. SL84]
MIVMTLEKVPESLHGELSRWLIEVQTGVYIGSVSAVVRDLLWDKVVQHSRSGRCTQLFRSNNEQGFVIRMHGEARRTLVDVEGYQLVAVKNARYEQLLPKFTPEEEDDWETL